MSKTREVKRKDIVAYRKSNPKGDISFVEYARANKILKSDEVPVISGKKLPGRHLKDMSNLNLSGFVFQNCEFDTVDLSGANLEGVRFEHCTINNTNCKNASLDNATFIGGSIADTDMTEVKAGNVTMVALRVAQLRIDNSDFTDLSVTGCEFFNLYANNTQLERSKWHTSSINSCDWSQVHLKEVTLDDCIITEVTFKGAEVDRTNITGGTVTGSIFTALKGPSTSVVTPNINLTNVTMSNNHYDTEAYGHFSEDFRKIEDAEIEAHFAEMGKQQREANKVEGESIMSSPFDDSVISTTTMTDMDRTDTSEQSSETDESMGSDIESVEVPQEPILLISYYASLCQSGLDAEVATDKEDEALTTPFIAYAAQYGVEITPQTFVRADLRGLDLSEGNYTGLQLPYAHLAGTRFMGADLTNVNMKDTILVDTDFTDATLVGANRTQSPATLLMQYAYQCREEITKNVPLENQEAANQSFIEYASEHGLNVTKDTFQNALLMGADLSHADLSDMDLTGAQLMRANLSYAFLEGTNLNQTDVSEVNFEGASISEDTLFRGVVAYDTTLPTFEGREVDTTPLPEMTAAAPLREEQFVTDITAHSEAVQMIAELKQQGHSGMLRLEAEGISYYINLEEGTIEQLDGGGTEKVGLTVEALSILCDAVRLGIAHPVELSFDKGDTASLQHHLQLYCDERRSGVASVGSFKDYMVLHNLSLPTMIKQSGVEAVDLTGLDLSDADLSNLHFYHADFTGSNLNNVTVNNTIFEACIMENIQLDNVTLTDEQVVGCDSNHPTMAAIMDRHRATKAERTAEVERAKATERAEIERQERCELPLLTPELIQLQLEIAHDIRVFKDQDKVLNDLTSIVDHIAIHEGLQNNDGVKSAIENVRAMQSRMEAISPARKKSETYYEGLCGLYGAVMHLQKFAEQQLPGEKEFRFPALDISHVTSKLEQVDSAIKGLESPFSHLVSKRSWKAFKNWARPSANQYSGPLSEFHDEQGVLQTETVRIMLQDDAKKAEIHRDHDLIKEVDFLYEKLKDEHREVHRTYGDDHITQLEEKLTFLERIQEERMGERHAVQGR